MLGTYYEQRWLDGKWDRLTDVGSDRNRNNRTETETYKKQMLLWGSGKYLSKQTEASSGVVSAIAFKEHRDLLQSN